jgi:hypothetical protein
MNMVELEWKKVLIWPSQAKTTKENEVVIGEERPPRMIKQKSLKDGQWQKNEGASRHAAQRPHSTSSWPSTKKARTMLGGAKTGPSGIPNRTVRFP